MAAVTVPYIPTQQTTDDFWAQQARLQALTSPQVPQGFPSQLKSPLVWTAAEAEQKSSQWVLNLTNDDITAIETALDAFERTKLDLSELSISTFSLPSNFCNKLRQVSDQLYNGLGFKVIHGLDPLKYTEKQNAIVYAGIAAHIAPLRGFQDLDSTVVIGHNINLAGESSQGKNVGPAFTNTPVAFHSDSCEILSFYVLDQAASGGRTQISSSWQIYNELAWKNPEVLRTLAGQWVLDSFTDYAKYPPQAMPFLQNAGNGKINLRFTRYRITGFEARLRNPLLPPPTQEQIAALDAVHLLAAKNAITLPLGKGDMAFINDTAILHARESFKESGQDPRRHLLKLYLRDPEKNWPVPASFAKQFMEIYGPNCEDGTRKELWPVALSGPQPQPPGGPGPDPEPHPAPQPRMNG